jgi:hypothetical protein
VDIDEIGGWFHPNNRRHLDRLIKEYNIQSVLEIGSFLGLSAIWFARRVPQVTCIDLWREDAEFDNKNNLVNTLRRFGTPRDFYHVFQGNLKEFGVTNVETIRGNSRDVHHLAVDHQLVYIDGDHSLEGCREDLRLYGPKATRILCGDDYAEREEFGVIQAVGEYIPRQYLNAEFPFWWTIK